MIPVLCGTDRIGISIILNSMCAFFDSANHPKNALIVKDLKKDDEKILECNEDSPTSLFVFKTITDPFVGKTSYFKVTSGTLYTGMTLYNPKEKEDEKIVKIYQPMGKNLIEVDKLHAGEIGAFTRSATCHTNDTLCDPRSPILIPDTEYSKPYYKKAIVPLGKSNEEKIANAINRSLEEDPTLVYEYNEETKQQCLSGIGDIHLDTVLNKLKARFKVEAKFEDVKIPYRETIKKEVTQRTRYKKQSGGHGQFGEVEITFKPSRDYDKPYIFKEEVFGGAVPRTYFPAVEKGLIESVKAGCLGGYPVLGIEATLIDGAYHSVDSSEMAFKSATSMCFKESMP